MSSPVLTFLSDSSFQYNVGKIWINPGSPVTIDSSNKDTQVFAMDSSAMPQGVFPNPGYIKYRLTDVWNSSDGNFDGVNELENHTLSLAFQTSSDCTNWTSQKTWGMTAIENETGRFQYSVAPADISQYYRVTARVYPKRDSSHSQATVLMGLENVVMI